MTETFGYDPKLHDALRWSVVKNGKRWQRGFNSEDAAWRATGCNNGMTTAQLAELRKSQGYSVVPIAWSYKPKFRKTGIHILMPERKKVVDSSLPV